MLQRIFNMWVMVHGISHLPNKLQLHWMKTYVSWNHDSYDIIQAFTYRILSKSHQPRKWMVNLWKEKNKQVGYIAQYKAERVLP